MFMFDKERGLVNKESDIKDFVIASDRSDFVGQSKTSSINHHAGDIVKSVGYGVLWNFSKTDKKTVDLVIKSKVLYNPHSMYLLRS